MLAALLCHPVLCVKSNYGGDVAGFGLREHLGACTQAVKGGCELLGHCGCAGEQRGHHQGHTHHAHRITWITHIQLKRWTQLEIYMQAIQGSCELLWQGRLRDGGIAMDTVIMRMKVEQWQAVIDTSTISMPSMRLCKVLVSIDLQAVQGSCELLGHCGCAGEQCRHHQGHTHHAHEARAVAGCHRHQPYRRLLCHSSKQHCSSALLV